ncbi:MULTISPECIES: hypothetical protein [Citrobacter]|uniref:MarR family transcriptional regulator n=1 Tax=Citrobacter telavivensis TaxID=2653932 RepID=A0A6L5ECF8_9ENTR|nr:MULTISPECIES: hypothetical protein [Citrobacter]MPQ52821.1 hypothetical protein [Citrobacter telavivensis]QFS70137.1 hypothetical protein GBC03_07920 [Citrobacter telavivensis]CAI9388468.1 hypothetical protein CITSP_00498 [Citrobacter sp. T1.2D-1]
MKTNNVELQLLYLLLKSHNQLDSFTAFKRMRISFAEFSKTLYNLKQLKLIEELDKKIKLTKTGYVRAFTEYSSKTDKKWREVPSTFKLNEYDIDEPYLPNLRLLDPIKFPIAKSKINR